MNIPTIDLLTGVFSLAFSQDDYADLNAVLNLAYNDRWIILRMSQISWGGWECTFIKAGGLQKTGSGRTLAEVVVNSWYSPAYEPYIAPAPTDEPPPDIATIIPRLAAVREVKVTRRICT